MCIRVLAWLVSSRARWSPACAPAPCLLERPNRHGCRAGLVGMTPGRGYTLGKAVSTSTTVGLPGTASLPAHQAGTRQAHKINLHITFLAHVALPGGAAKAPPPDPQGAAPPANGGRSQGEHGRPCTLGRRLLQAPRQSRDRRQGGLAACRNTDTPQGAPGSRTCAGWGPRTAAAARARASRSACAALCSRRPAGRQPVRPAHRPKGSAILSVPGLVCRTPQARPCQQARQGRGTRRARAPGAAPQRRAQPVGPAARRRTGAAKAWELHGRWPTPVP